MSTDTEYADFLAKSQRQYDGAHSAASKTQSTPSQQAVTSQLLSSESDEPFYPVDVDMSLGVDFAQCAGVTGDLRQAKLADYSDYDEVIQYVASRSGTDATRLEVYEVQSGARIHVFIVGRKDKHWVGVRSLKVES